MLNPSATLKFPVINYGIRVQNVTIYVIKLINTIPKQPHSDVNSIQYFAR